MLTTLTNEVKKKKKYWDREKIHTHIHDQPKVQAVQTRVLDFQKIKDSNFFLILIYLKKIYCKIIFKNKF